MPPPCLAPPRAAGRVGAVPAGAQTPIKLTALHVSLWPEYDRAGAVHVMRRLAGCDYGYASLLMAGMLHLPLVRWLVRPNVTDGTHDRRPPFCSQACAMAVENCRCG